MALLTGRCKTKFLTVYPMITSPNDKFEHGCPLNIQALYTPGIYADRYIVFVFPFVRSSVCMFVCSFVRLFVRNSVTFVEFASKFCVKVSQVVYISATTYQKAFIFGP